MYMWLLIGGAAYGLVQILRHFLGDQDLVTEDETQSKNDSHRDLPTRSSTTKTPAYCVNKSQEGTNSEAASTARLKSRTSPPSSSFNPKSSIPSYAVPTYRSRPVSSSFSQASSFPAAPPFTSDQPHSSAKPSPAPCGTSQSSAKAPPSTKPTLLPLDFNPTSQHKNANYKSVQKGTSPIYMIPKDIESLIKKDIVPDVLKKPLSPSTYRDYFASLLYAEDFYIEKWSDYQLSNVTLELHKAAIYNKSLKNKKMDSDEKEDKVFVAFEIDSVPERRPFLLSRDFVHSRRSGSNAKEFQGVLYRVVKHNRVLVEFEEDFYSQYHPNNRYDISFSFNRVCLKRAHQAVAAASGSLLENYLFPDCTTRKNLSSSATCLYGNHKLDACSNSAVRQILRLDGGPPYLLEGPLCVTGGNLSKSGQVVCEAVLEIYKRSSKNRILLCSPINKTGDILMRSLKNKIPESDMFRANAAFREVDGVPVDILPLCLYEGGECFSFPSLLELRQFRVVFSTFVSSFRLHNEGITAGHFSHIFLVDASSATEPQTMIPLTTLADQDTTVTVTGAPGNSTSWVRSEIARKNGLRMSYFERLRASKTYRSSDPMFISLL